MFVYTMNGILLLVLIRSSLIRYHIHDVMDLLMSGTLFSEMTHDGRCLQWTKKLSTMDDVYNGQCLQWTDIMPT